MCGVLSFVSICDHRSFILIKCTLARRNVLVAQVCINGVIIFSTIVYIFWACWDSLTRKSVYVTLFCTMAIHGVSIPMLIALTYKTRRKHPSSHEHIDAHTQFNTHSDAVRHQHMDLMPVSSAAFNANDDAAKIHPFTGIAPE